MKKVMMTPGVLVLNAILFTSMLGSFHSAFAADQATTLASSLNELAVIAGSSALMNAMTAVAGQTSGKIDSATDLGSGAFLIASGSCQFDVTTGYVEQVQEGRSPFNQLEVTDVKSNCKN